MFGEILVRYCPNCKEDVKYTTTILYMIDREEFTESFDCPKCNEDLKEDKAIIEKARNEGKSVAIVMC